MPCQKMLAVMSSYFDAFLKGSIMLSRFVHFRSWSVNSVLLLPRVLFPTILPVTAIYSSLSFLIMCPKKEICLFEMSDMMYKQIYTNN